MTSPDHSAARGAHDAFERAEFPFSRRDFDQIVRILHDDAGIYLGETKASLVYSRLVRRLRKLGIDCFKTYCELVTTEEGAEERRSMVAALTTNVTHFFRDPNHFEHLRSRVLPDLIDGAHRGGRIRIWSAGCSTGEEPYSIAMTILSAMPDAYRFDVKVLAIDINRQVLDQARRGVYREADLGPVSLQQRADWFVHAGDDERGSSTWRVRDELRSLVAFRELNLTADWPMKQAYQAIFCCNVAIYFEESVRAQTWERLSTLLAPRGCLYVGHSEIVPNASGRFQPEGGAIYRLKDSVRP